MAEGSSGTTEIDEQSDPAWVRRLDPIATLDRILAIWHGRSPGWDAYEVPLRRSLVVTIGMLVGTVLLVASAILASAGMRVWSRTETPSFSDCGSVLHPAKLISLGRFPTPNTAFPCTQSLEHRRWIVLVLSTTGFYVIVVPLFRGVRPRIRRAERVGIT